MKAELPVELSPAIYFQLELMSQEKGIDLNEMFVEVIAKYLRNQEK